MMMMMVMIAVVLIMTMTMMMIEIGKKKTSVQLRAINAMAISLGRSILNYILLLGVKDCRCANFIHETVRYYLGFKQRTKGISPLIILTHEEGRADQRSWTSDGISCNKCQRFYT